VTDTPAKKFFTVEEANQTLPLVRVIVDDIVKLFGDVHDRRERLAKIRHRRGVISSNEENIYDEELKQFEEELDKDIKRLQEFSDELRKIGAVLKDFVSGLVDFPMLMDEREVCLCWKLGEDEIGYWHEIDAGFSGRQPLLELEGSVSGDETTDDESG